LNRMITGINNGVTNILAALRGLHIPINRTAKINNIQPF